MKLSNYKQIHFGFNFSLSNSITKLRKSQKRESVVHKVNVSLYQNIYNSTEKSNKKVVLSLSFELKQPLKLARVFRLDTLVRPSSY